MKPRVSLSTKIFVLAALNVLLLFAIFEIFTKLELRMDLGTFVFAPIRDRILSVSRLIGLELPETDSWDALLERYSSTYPAQFFLFRDRGEQLAGKKVDLPAPLANWIREDHNPFREGPRERESAPRPQMKGGPPVLLIRAGEPPFYWAATHLPVRRRSGEVLHGSLVWRFPALWSNPFFFDYKPYLAAVGAIILVFIACWLPLIRGLTRSIRQLTEATRHIAEGRFEIPVAIRRRDELGLLGESIHRMAERLSELVHGQKRFLGDIAHELCTPISRMQFALGILEQRAEPKQKTYVTDLQEELEHMSGLVDELLSFSKAQLTSQAAQLEPVNLAETVRKVLQREASDLANVEVLIDERIEVWANPDYLFRSVANLVRNAIRYAGDAGPITVSGKRDGGNVWISVADRGPGLPDKELENVFKPFYRPEFARQRETGGVGLGLAIVRSCVEPCGGAVNCRNRSPKGLEVEIRLLASPAAV